MSKTIEEKVEAALDQLRPNLRADGGDIELLGIENGVVKVKMKGSCAGCPMSAMTLRWGVENFIKNKIPEIAKVEAIQS